MLRIGIIGCGARAAWIVSCIQGTDPEAVVRIIADPNPAKARHRLDAATVPHDSARFVSSADERLEDAAQLDGLFLGPPCDLHAPLAVKVAPTGLPLFLEKPIAISAEQLSQLHHAYLGREDSVVVSFPLRVTPLFQKVLEIVRSGRLGIINQVQAVNYVPYGGVYFGQWYRDYNVTGGLWLQKATHDFDCIHQIIGAAPTGVVAMSSRKVYGGDMPEDLHCSACDLARECPESPASIAARDDDGGMGRGDHPCAFAKSIKHHDAGSAMIYYADGAHAAYSQNFLSRRSAGSRGARITGYEGTLTFDWYSESIQLIEHHGKVVENVKVEVPDGHHGGDSALARNFVEIMRRTGASRSTLKDGVLSAATCIAARTSESTHQIEPVVLPWPMDRHPIRKPLSPPRIHVTLGQGLCGSNRRATSTAPAATNGEVSTPSAG